MYNLATDAGIDQLYNESVEDVPHHYTPTKLSTSRQSRVRPRPNTGLYIPSCTPTDAFDMATERF
mgnify:CR=1 FL=1